MDAPSSLTVQTLQPSGRRMRFMKSSVSREAVPLPMATAWMAYLSSICCTAMMALTLSFCGGCG